MPQPGLRIAAWVFAFAAAAFGAAPSQNAPIHEIQVVAKKYSFEPATIDVIAGERVRLVIRSADSVHGFTIDALKVDVQIPRGGEAATVEFDGPPAGTYEIACSEFCGSGHGHMKAALVSHAPGRLTKGRI